MSGVPLAMNAGMAQMTIDVCLYSLRKWAGLAAKGNPTALHFLFSQNYAPQPEPWEEILKHRNVFLSRPSIHSIRWFR